MGWWVSTTRAIPAGEEKTTGWTLLSQEREAASGRSSRSGWTQSRAVQVLRQGLDKQVTLSSHSPEAYWQPVITTPSSTAPSLCIPCLLASLLLTARLWCTSPGVQATSEELLPWDVGSCPPTQQDKTQGVKEQSFHSRMLPRINLAGHTTAIRIQSQLSAPTKSHNSSVRKISLGKALLLSVTHQ